MHESACSIREEKKTLRVFHSPSHFVIKNHQLKTTFRGFNHVEMVNMLKTFQSSNRSSIIGSNWYISFS